MNIELLSHLSNIQFNKRKELLQKCALTPDDRISRTAMVWDGDFLAACGSREENIIKCVAVDPTYRGEDLTSSIITALRRDAFEQGYGHLFLYTKPENSSLFSSLFFYPVAQTDKVLLMENRKNGIHDFVASLPKSSTKGIVGAAVMNCNPFTLGHRYLIEKAAADCDLLYVFIVSEDKSRFSFRDRIEMAKLGTKDLKNVMVLPTGPYLISSATFPTYFLKERDKADEVQCLLDIEIFSKHFAPKLSITRRYAGTEPLSAMTAGYNRAMKDNLQKYGICFTELPRLEIDGTTVSASLVRRLIDEGKIKEVKTFVPDTTYEYLKKLY